MKSFSSKFINFSKNDHGVVEITFNRPEVKNALSAEMISDLIVLFDSLARTQNPYDLRLVILKGEGNVFSAGADLNYMREQSGKSYDENIQDANRLGKMFYHLTALPCPVLSAVKGAAFGGGLGLCACSDFVLADDKALFATSEVKLGLVPAVISPYVIRKLGMSHASHLMLTGSAIDANQALQMGLVNKLCDINSFDTTLNEVKNLFLLTGPNASWLTKELIQKSSPLPDPELFEFTTQKIAMTRSSKEGKIGLQRFFEKKRPEWCP